MELRLKYIEMLENGVLECLKSTYRWRFSGVNKIQQELQGKNSNKDAPRRTKDDGVVENKSLGLQLKMMTKAFGFTVALNRRINSKRMGELGKNWLRYQRKLSIFTLKNNNED
jgi:hypothetical protein